MFLQATCTVVRRPLYEASCYISVFLCFASGTGNVLKIQSLLHICSEFYSTEKKEEEGEAEVGGKKGEGEEGGKETPMDEGNDTGMRK